MDYQEAIQYLYSLRNRTTTYGVERMQLLADALGNPENDFPIIHVAGTNGKGSVCATLESIYRHAGFKTGLSTSPHLVHLGERVQVNRVPLKPEEICAQLPHLQNASHAIAARNKDLHPSFFEFMTALAFDVFKAETVDIALIETGLGGRLDASNIVSPELSIITSIALDHTDILGNTIEAIAEEKAGIIKENTPVLTGLLPQTAEICIREIARKRNAPFHSIKEKYGDKLQDSPVADLKNGFQRINASIAHAAVKLLHESFPVADLSIRQGISNTQWQGRWEKITTDDNKLLILDATHNAEGLPFLEEELRALQKRSGAKPHIIFGTIGEQRAKTLIPVISKYAASIHIVEPAQYNATDPEFIKTLITKKEIPVYITEIKSLFPDANACALGNAGENIVATGSIYLIGEIMAQIKSPEFKGEPQLQG